MIKKKRLWVSVATIFTFFVSLFNGFVLFPGHVDAATFVVDDFVGMAGGTLQSHTGQTGATWTKINAAGSDMVFMSSPANYIRLNGTTEVAYYAAGVPADPDYDVQADLYRTGTASSGSIGLIARADTSAQTYYLARYAFSNQQWELVRFVNGSSTTLASFSQTLVGGTNYHAKFSVRGTRLVLYVNDMQVLSADDGVITAAGRAGIGGVGVGAQSDATAFLGIRNFVAGDPTLFVEDTLRATGGSTLQAHVGEVGATWTKHPSSAGDDFVFTGSPANYVRNAGPGNEVFYYASGVPGSADYDVQATVVRDTAATAYAGVLGRVDVASKTAYSFRFYRPTSVWHLLKWVNGTPTLLGSWDAATTSGTDTMILRMRGTAITGIVNGAVVISVNDASIAAAGRAGVSGVFVGTPTDTSAGLRLQHFSATDGAKVSVANANIRFSPYNWYVNGNAYAEANSSGPYFKIGFTGTNFALHLDQSGMTDYPIIAYSIDGGPITRITTTAANYVSLTPVPLSFGNHEMTVWADSVPFTNGSLGSQGGDRFTPVDRLRILGIELDAGAMTFAPTLKPKNILIYGDSAAEGSVQMGSQNTTANQRWTTTWGKLLGDALNAEVGAVVYQGQGYQKTAPLGGTPGFLSAYNKINSAVDRVFIPEPDYVFIEHGTNAPPSTTPSDVTTMIAALRAQMPNTPIIVMVPFGQYSAAAINTGFTSQSDAHAVLMDLGQAAVNIVNNNSTDGVHPTPNGYSLLANLVYSSMDLTAPTISGLGSGVPGTDSATITWTTNEPSNSWVEYGLTNAYGSSTALDPSMRTAGHAMSLNGLLPGTLYYYRIISKDAMNNVATSTEQVFTTAELPPPCEP